MFRFEYPIYLVSLLLIPILGWLLIRFIRWKELTRRRIGDENLVNALTSDYAPGKFLAKYLLVLTAFLLTGMGAANLQYPRQIEEIKRQGVDVLIALDVSGSMLADDLRPSRLDRAKFLVQKLMDRLPNDRIGLLLFAGRAYLQMPLTSDHAAARMYLQAASPASVPAQGTVLGEALSLAGNSFPSQDQKKYKVIILITDGEGHDSQASAVMDDLLEKGVILHCVGIGSPSGIPLNDPLTGQARRDRSGNIVVTRLQEEELKALALKGKGTYLRLSDPESAVNTLREQIRKMEQKSITDASQIRYRSFFQWFLGLALILLILEHLVSEKKRGGKA